MKSIRHIALASILGGALLTSAGCKRAGGEYPGTEYMPDMVHSIAYEANYSTYYRNNTWGTPEEYREMHDPRLPVQGTIPRGSSAFKAANEVHFKIDTFQLSVPLTYHPYRYGNTEEERARAQKEIVSNPLVPQSQAQLDAILERGKGLYNSYCSVCHGTKGDGNGPLWKDGEGPYKAAPAIFTGETFKNAGNTDGRYYHAIMYGKNAMMPHADKLNYEERWMVIHYIRSLQDKSYDIVRASGKVSSIEPQVEPATEEKAPANDTKTKKKTK